MRMAVVHAAIYVNAKGTVWAGALEALHVLGEAGFAGPLPESASRLGGDPLFDREERSRIVEETCPRFEDIDDRIGRDERMTAYIREHPDAFLLEVLFERPTP